MPQRLARQRWRRPFVDLMPGSTLDVALSWHSWTLDTPFTKLLSEQIVKSARDYLQ